VSRFIGSPSAPKLFSRGAIFCLFEGRDFIGYGMPKRGHPQSFRSERFREAVADLVWNRLSEFTIAGQNALRLLLERDRERTKEGEGGGRVHGEC